jgi:large subunit ribosomal protein L14
MIQRQTKLKLGDNSGIRFAKCLSIYKNRIGFTGLVILISIKSVKSQSKIKKGSIYKGIIIRIKRKIQRQNGNSIFFNENAIVILNKKNDLFSTRIFGPVCNELRKKNLLKVLSLGSIIV